jgi:hypothetical protein
MRAYPAPLALEVNLFTEGVDAMSLIGPLVTPNRYESRFDRLALYIPTFKHPLIVGALIILLAAAGIGVVTHIIPLPF